MAGRTIYDFNGSVAIVTGAASGIGFETARRFLQAGARVALNDLDPVRLDAAATRLAAEAGEALQVPCDVRNEADVRAAVARIADSWGRIDALVNCAGIADEMKPTFQQDIDRWQCVLDVSLRGSYLFTREVARHMAQAGSGAVVTLGSIAGVTGMPGRNAYSAAKAGIAAMTQALAAEWGALGIRVNVIAPGYVRTPMVAGLTQRGALALDGILARTPMRRLGEAHEIADTALFLCSEAASFITGACLPVDGGWVAFGASALPETLSP